MMSNFGLYKALDQVGIGYAKTAVGDKYVYEQWCSTGTVLEASSPGILFFPATPAPEMEF